MTMKKAKNYHIRVDHSFQIPLCKVIILQQNMPVKVILSTSYPVHITSVMIVHASLMTIIIVHSNLKKKCTSENQTVVF